MNLLGFLSLNLPKQVLCKKREMEELKQLIDLLPIDTDFTISRIERNESEQTVHIYLIVDKKSKPKNVSV